MKSILPLAVLVSFPSIGLLAVEEPRMVKTTVAYRQVDGREILADVYRPDDVKARPVVVWIHGGALIMGHRESVKPQIAQLAAEQGYALVSLDYRLAPETKLPEIVGDLEAAFAWIAGAGAERFHLDPARIAVAGSSAGGYLTLLAGYKVRPRPKVLVAFWGYGDLVGPWYSTPSPHPCHNPRKVTAEEALGQTDGTPISDARERQGNGGLIYLHCRQRGTWPKVVTGFDPNTQADRIAPFEPLRNVKDDYPPAFLIHGTSDTDVPFEQSAMMAEQFRRHGVPHVLKAIEGGEHGLPGGDPGQIEEAYRSMAEFVVRHMGSP